MMNVSDNISRIKKLQEKFVAAKVEIQKRITNMTKPLEKHIKKRFADEFPGVDFFFLISFQVGCLTNNWKPQIFLYKVNNLSYSPEGYWYGEFKLDKHSPPLATRKLRTFLKTLGDEIGVKIQFVSQKPYWVIEEEEKRQSFLEKNVACGK